MIELGEWLILGSRGAAQLAGFRFLRASRRSGTGVANPRNGHDRFWVGEDSIERHIAQCIAGSEVNITHIVQYFEYAKIVEFLRFFKSLF